MKKINNIFIMGLCLLTLVIFSSCENEEENISFTPGTNLIITGSEEIISTETETYFVEGFTINEQYTWSIAGPGNATVTVVSGRDGEFVDVVVADAGTYTLSVENDKGLSGSLEIVVTDE